jgi:Domain of unknown function (DUF4034)
MRIANTLLSGRKGFTFLLLLAVGFTEASCGHAKASVPVIPMVTVIQNIREYGGGKSPVTLTSSKSPATQDSIHDPYDLDGPYQAHIGVIFAQGDFGQLEKIAHQVRVDRSRLSGGVWKLYGFYEGVSKPPAGNRSTDAEWKAHIDDLEKWVAASPQSASARIALAQGYIYYAWFARGEGYANSVSDNSWYLFNERISLAKATLVDAAHLKEECPYWYEAMQVVAYAQGWNKQQARELFNQATAFEPTYYHYYREYANYLLPKWYGEEGETQALAEEVSSHLPEPDSSMVYFEIASLRACQCDSERDSLEGVSWPKIKQGYAEMTRLYGTSNLKANRFAYVSFVADDHASAQSAFSTIGTEWDRTVWRSAANFDSVRSWAMSQ